MVYENKLTSSTSISPHQVYMVNERLQVHIMCMWVYTLLTVHIKCIWSTNFYKFTSSYQTSIQVHIKCIWWTNGYKFTSYVVYINSVYGALFTSSVCGVWTFTSWHQVCMVNERLQVHIMCMWWYTLLTVHIKCIWSTNFYKFTSSVYGERTSTSSHQCGVHTSNSSH